MARMGFVALIALPLVGIPLLMLYLDVLGPVVDYFANFSTEFPIVTHELQECMSGVGWFAFAFYFVICAFGVIYVVYPIIAAISQKGYEDVSPVQDQPFDQ